MGPAFMTHSFPSSRLAKSMGTVAFVGPLLLFSAGAFSGAAREGSPPIDPSVFPRMSGRPSQVITVSSLLREMTDLDALATRPAPWFKQAAVTSFSRESLKGGDAWFDNRDVGQYVRTDTNAGRKEHVLADLRGPGTVSRFWSANPDLDAPVRFYFDGESEPRLVMPVPELFSGKSGLFPPAFSYVSGTGGNLYFPLPYASSLKITVEEKAKPIRLYYEIGYRTYEAGAEVETFDPSRKGEWTGALDEAADRLSHPGHALKTGSQRSPAPRPADSLGTSAPAGAGEALGVETLSYRLTVRPGKTAAIPPTLGEKTVIGFSAQVIGTRESRVWTDPRRPHNAYRSLLLDIGFDGEPSILTPLGDFFGSGPGVNPYENLFFTVASDGRMTSRLRMPFKSAMRLALTNYGRIAYTVDIRLAIAALPFTDRSYHLRAQWGSVTRDSWPFFDVNFLETSGEGKVVGTVYEIANPTLIWWGEGDQKVRVDGEDFPSTFGTGTEDDYGFAYGDNRLFTRPYHAQTRVDGPWSGGHISLNRWYVLDALPYRSGIRFDQEMWHWMPCWPTWDHVIYWYAKSGTPGPRAIDRAALPPRDLGIREDMLEPYEAEALPHEETGGAAGAERLANCSGAEHLIWRGAKKGDRLKVRFPVPEAGRYSIELNLCQSPDYGRQRLFVNGRAVRRPINCYSPKLYWLHAKLGVFDLLKGENTIEAETLDPDPDAKPGNLFGLDYIFLVKIPKEAAR